jgi:uncharacterized membrane protein YbhN (UPF0104 family)
VPDRGLLRRPSEVARILIGALVVAVGAYASRHYTGPEQLVRDLILQLPTSVLDALRVLNGAGVLLSVLVVLLAALFSRRIRFIGGVVVAGLLGVGSAWALQGVVDAQGAVGDVAGYPPYPSIRLTWLAAVFFVAAPELTRPARRLQWLLLVMVSVSVVAVTDGYPSGVFGSLALGWAVGALVHLAFGSPDGVPDPADVTTDALALGVELGELTPSAVQIWGEAAFDSSDDEGELRVVVIGRDATDAQFFGKALRFIAYKDSGPSLLLSRTGQIEHRAFMLLLAERAGVHAPRVVASGAAGDRGDALLVLRQEPGRPVSLLDADECTDAVLDAAWAALAELHGAGISHGGLEPGALRLAADGTVWFTDLAVADPTPSDETRLADRAALLVTTTVLTDQDRAIAAARRCLGDDDLVATLPLLQSAALPRGLRRSVHDLRKVMAGLREAITEATGAEAPELVELHRVSPANLAMAAGAALGVYLLIGQLTQVDYAAMIADADWAWLPLVILFSQTPQFGSAMAMLGSVSRPLPLTPVIGVQFANNFTGLVGGTVATFALVVRFFQRQGLGPAVAVSSGAINTIGAMVCQTILVVLGLIVTWGDYDVSSTGGSSSGGDSGGLLLVGIIVAAVVSGVLLLIPRLRRKVSDKVRPQLSTAWSNLREVLKEPKKGVQLFGGNLIAQIFFACTLWAALEMYGAHLSLLELVVINSFASILGGVAPVPGGLGVIEAGLIAGFTAAGVPETAAVGATFTARMFTAYLPPIWGWFALEWLRRKEYV